MSRTSRWQRLRQRSDEGGFTLVEVMAAMVVFALVATAVTAMFATGLRASLLTKMDTTAKNLSQQRFEAIRNLPFHIDQVSAGTNPPDLLDTYFVNSTGSVGRGAQGYVPAGATRWTDDGDPATGAFYRYVEAAVPGFPKFKQYVATQFLDDSGNPYTPTNFNTQVAGSDVPPTTTVGVSVTTLWTAGTLDRVSRTYSQISSGQPSEPNAVLQSRLTALRLSGGISGGRTLTVDLAALTADGSLADTVSAAQALRGGILSLSTGTSVNGSAASVVAPPNAAATSNSTGSKNLSDGGFTFATMGSTNSSNVSATSSTGQVVLGSSTSPATASVLGAGAGTKTASFALDGVTDSRLGLTGFAYVEDAGCGGGCTNVGVTGYANTAKSTGLYSTTTSATALVRGALVLLPTTYAPNGLIRIKLTTATVGCSVTHSSAGSPVASATVTYSGSLAYWAPYAPGNVGGYVTVALSSSDAVSPLTADLLAQTQVANDSTGNPLWLSDYFAEWSSMDAPTASSSKTIGADGTTVSTSFSGMIGVSTQPMVTGDPTSVIGAELGVGSCTAEDYR